MEKYINESKFYRVFGILFILFGLNYLVWLSHHLNPNAPFISYPFLFAYLFTFLTVTLSIINHWKAKYRIERPPLPKSIPVLAIVVPTYKEPIEVIRKTIKSLLNLNYPQKVVIVVSNDDASSSQKDRLTNLMSEIYLYWNSLSPEKRIYPKSLHLIHSSPHNQAKAGNLNQAINFLRKYYPNIDLVLTQDADEICYPDLLIATVGYFSDPRVAYVQTIKQVDVAKGDPFGNQDLMWYARTAACRDASNAMFACGSGVVWRISAIEAIGGFSTWNMVEDLTTSYELLAYGWESRYHYEALSKGLAPEDLPNYLKQRGTWAMDSLRIFFWDNPLFKKGLTISQRLQFLETPLFYLNGVSTILIAMVTSLSLVFEKWPTTADALTHALFLVPSFLSLEIYYLLLAGNIPFRRIRQYWVGLSPLFFISALKSLIYGPNKKPTYVVTRKNNLYGNYLNLVWLQILVLFIITVSILKIFLSTPLYSKFDWIAIFWGLYQISFFTQIVKVSSWKWRSSVDITFSLDNEFQKLRTYIGRVAVNIGSIF
jgi:cellulose synthase (UDP-forming)